MIKLLEIMIACGCDEKEGKEKENEEKIHERVTRLEIGSEDEIG